jgi:hypothetical protein
MIAQVSNGDKITPSMCHSSHLRGEAPEALREENICPSYQDRAATASRAPPSKFGISWGTVTVLFLD